MLMIAADDLQMSYKLYTNQPNTRKCIHSLFYTQLSYVATSENGCRFRYITPFPLRQVHLNPKVHYTVQVLLGKLLQEFFD